MQKAKAIAPTQTIPTARRESRRPKKNMMAAPAAGSRGITQMWERKKKRLSARADGVMTFSLRLFRGSSARPNFRSSASLPFQQVHFVDVHRLLIAEEGDQDAETDRCFGGGVGDDENCEDLALQAPDPGEGDQVQVHSVQDQLDRHQHDDHIAAREDTNHTQHEERSGYDEIMQCSDGDHKTAFSS